LASGNLPRVLLAGALVLACVSLCFPSIARAIDASGALSQPTLACIGEEKEEVAKCGEKVPYGLSYAYQIVISPNGEHAYSVGVQGDVIEYSRNLANGSLSVIGCLTSLALAEPKCAGENESVQMGVEAVGDPSAVAISPDGKSVYVTSQLNNTIAEFRVGEGGVLEKIGCITRESTLSECETTGAKGLENPYGVTVSPEGENVYVTAFSEEAVGEFKRNTETGVLTQLAPPNECIGDAGSSCATKTIGLQEDIGIAVSPDGKDVYVAAGAKSSKGDVAALARGAEGALEPLSSEERCIGSVSECATGANIDGVEDLAVSSDGKYVYGTSSSTNAVIELKRTGGGALEQLAAPNECVSTESLPGCKEVVGIGGTVGVAISPGGEDLYASGQGEGSVAAFERDLETGALTQLATPCVTTQSSGCGSAEFDERVGLEWPRRLAVSPDGTNVYASSQSSHAIAELDRTVTPTVSKLEPGEGGLGGGTTVQIEGSGFAEGATVEFGGVEAEGVTVNSATSITATSPPGTQPSVGVTVTNAAGSSPAVPADEYGYQAGGLSLSGYCEAIGDDGNAGNPVVLAKEVVEGPEFAYNNWACVTDAGALVLIANSGPAPSMANACALAYPKVTTFAYPEAEDNAFTWGCHLTSSPSLEREREREKANETEHPQPKNEPLPEAKIASSGPGPSSTILGSTVPAPVLAVTGNVAPVSGTVLVRLPGTSAFVPLGSLRQIPFGTLIEATHGHVSVTTTEPNGTTQTGEFFEGEFMLEQGHNGLVVAELAGGNFAVCPTARERAHKARAGAAASHTSGKHAVRKLWANAHGSFSTKGNYAAGAVQGTEWLTEDLCEGTIIRVTRDKVAVTNLVTHRRVEVTTGHKYLAKAP
jgi:DNA-binding beta-propeller fold protein YncE